MEEQPALLYRYAHFQNHYKAYRDSLILNYPLELGCTSMLATARVAFTIRQTFFFTNGGDKCTVGSLHFIQTAWLGLDKRGKTNWQGFSRHVQERFCANCTKIWNIVIGKRWDLIGSTEQLWIWDWWGFRSSMRWGERGDHQTKGQIWVN